MQMCDGVSTLLLAKLPTHGEELLAECGAAWVCPLPAGWLAQ